MPGSSRPIAEKGLARSGIIILDALLKLRQACCDPRLLAMKSAQKAGSAKLERLMDLLGILLDEGRRVLIFSQFTSMLALIEAALRKAGIPYVLLTGDTRDREAPVRRFQAGEVPVFLISLKAGGVGLNLTAADTVIHYDPWWNPAVEDQATDRAHRIGQDKPVFVHRLITLGTIEEKMEVLKERKRALVAVGAGCRAWRRAAVDRGGCGGAVRRHLTGRAKRAAIGVRVLRGSGLLRTETLRSRRRGMESGRRRVQGWPRSSAVPAADNPNSTATPVGAAQILDQRPAHRFSIQG